MKKEKSLRKELAARKFHTPNKLLYWAYHFIGKYIVMPKYNYTYTVKDDINDCEGPCFLIWNHLSRVDHFYLMEAAYPRRFNMVAGYNEFFRGHLHTVFKMMKIIPKKNFTQDIAGLRGMNSIISQGGTVCFSPEGMSSIYGTNQPIVPGTGRFLKHYHLPVYFLKLKGSYLTSTKACLDERYGKVEGEMQLLFSAAQLDTMTDEEVDDAINAAFRHDDYAWSFEQSLTWKNPGGMCKQLNTICYKCPRCGAELKMAVEEKGNLLRCTECGNGARVGNDYRFVPLNDTCVLPASPAAWVTAERQDIIRQIRADKAYQFRDFVKIGDMPDDHFMKNKATTELCGSGVLTFDHAGIHFEGTRHGTDWKFDLSYSVIFSLVIVTDTTYFGLYVDGEYYEFFPESCSTGKMLLITEEMHRLHFNTWKNFPWNAELYDSEKE